MTHGNDTNRRKDDPGTLATDRIDAAVRADGTLSLPVKVHPGARGSRVAGFWNGHVKLDVREPAEGGRANAAAAALLAEALGVPRSRVRLEAGAASRRKRFSVEGLDIDDLAARLARALREP